jgi:N-acetylglucosaminyl-diphospho-decaprenol L-rhamnosyltransferase
MNHSLPPSLIELLRQRRPDVVDARYVLPYLDMTTYDQADGVTVIMIVYHTGKVLFESIERVLAEPLVKQFVIIDNGSNDRDAAHLRDLQQEHPHIVLVQGHGNIGFAKAANVGAVLANQPWLVVLNPDARLEPDCVRHLIEAARDRPSPCIVGARILNTDLTEQRGARRGEITPMTTLITLSRLWKLFPALRKFHIHRENEPVPDGPVAVPTISGACFAVSKRDFAKLEGFDARFFLHVEDIDLCWRARERGGVVLFHPDARVVHEGHTSRVEPVIVEWNKGRGLVYYFLKRSNGLWRKIYVFALVPFILGVSVARAALRPRLKDLDEKRH